MFDRGCSARKVYRRLREAGARDRDYVRAARWFYPWIRKRQALRAGSGVWLAAVIRRAIMRWLVENGVRASCCCCMEEIDSTHCIALSGEYGIPERIPDPDRIAWCGPHKRHQRTWSKSDQRRVSSGWYIHICIAARKGCFLRILGNGLGTRLQYRPAAGLHPRRIVCRCPLLNTAGSPPCLERLAMRSGARSSRRPGRIHRTRS